MIRNRIHIILILSLCLLSLNARTQARAKASVDRTTILVGEPIKLKIEATVPATANIKWATIDTIPHFEIIDKSTIDSSKEATLKTFRQQLTITSYDSGYWSIPAFTLPIGKQRLRTDTIAINVTFSPADPNQPYHDIKEIIEVKKPSNYLLYWILGAVTLLFAIAVYFILRKKKPGLKQEEVVSKLSPYEEAMQAIKELSKASPVDQVAIKMYFTKLNDILRVYLRRRFNYSTLEKTNEELILQLRNSKLRGEQFTRLAQALRMNDFIKFAKYTPTEAEKSELFNQISQSITSLEELNKPA